jgi:hypothetical protein
MAMRSFIALLTMVAGVGVAHADMVTLTSDVTTILPGQTITFNVVIPASDLPVNPQVERGRRALDMGNVAAWLYRAWLTQQLEKKYVS